jgi:hypothetical protein
VSGTRQSATSTCRFITAVCTRQKFGVHGYNRGDVAREEPLPSMLGHLFAMIGTCSSFCSPLLLEEGNSCARCVLRLEILEVVDVERVPGLAYALRLYQLLVN